MRMDEKTLDLIENVIVRDKDFHAEAKASCEDPEVLYPRLFKKRGLDMPYDALQLGIREIFSRVSENENSDALDGELSDDELELVSGGNSSSCYNTCGSQSYPLAFCANFCV